MIVLHSLDLKSLERQPVTSFLRAISSAYPQIARFRFSSYLKQNGLSLRLAADLDERDRQFLAKCEEASRNIHASLWNVFPHLALAEGKHLELFTDSALIHFHGPRAEEYLLSSEDLAGDGIGNLIERLPPEHGLTVCSDVRLASGATLHIPMMDFLCSPSDANENLVISIVRRLEQPRGLLANSGNSYHFYGCNLFENDEWRRFLARALLLSPITDPR